jgi:8-oxo-dGTP diphosphatase
MLPNPIVGTAVFVRWGKNVLLGRRKGSHGAGTWAPPGGKLDAGETIFEAGARELNEETGLVVQPDALRPIGFTDDLFEDRQLRFITLFLELRINDRLTVDVELREPEKCEGWCWMPVSALPDPLFLPVQNLVRSGFRFS